MGSSAAALTFLADFPAQRVSAVVFIVGAGLTIVIGFLRTGRAFLKDSPGALYVLVAGALLWPVPLDIRRWSTPVWIAGALALVVHLVVHGREPAAPRAGGT